eukprot:3457623-Rhodomonas_salina.2
MVLERGIGGSSKDPGSSRAHVSMVQWSEHTRARRDRAQDRARASWVQTARGSNRFRVRGQA